MRHHKSSSSTMLGPVFLALLLILAAPAFSAQTTANPVSALDPILRDLASYDGGLNSDVFWKLRDVVLASKDSPEARLACESKLLAFLESKATFTAKMAVGRQLRVIGGDKSIPALEKILLDPVATDIARYALESIPVRAADDALLEALGKTKGTVKIGIITSLGKRKTQSAVPALTKLLQGSDSDLAAAAAKSLGQIGTMDAAESLGRAFGGSQPGLKETVASALLQCAEDFISLKDRRASTQIYDKVLSEKVPVAIRRAALRGKIVAAGDQAAALILSTLAGKDPDFQISAIGQIKSVFTPTNIEPVCDALPGLPAAGQIALLNVLSEYSGPPVLAAVMKAAKSEAKDIRLAALQALEKIGDATVVSFLAETAAASTGTEQTAARTSLWGLKGKAVDEAVIDLLGRTSGDDVRAELIQSVGERRIFSAKSAAMKYADSPSPKVRTQVVKTVKAVGTPSDIPAFLAILLKTESEPEQFEMENAIVGLAQKIAGAEGRANAVRSRLSSEKDASKRAVLFRLLGKIGDDSGLPLLRAGLRNPDAALADAAARALVAWPTTAAKDDVLQIARTSKNQTHKVLAIQAYLRLTGVEKFRAPEVVAGELKQALDLASRPEEKKLLLGILPDFACPETLKIAESLTGTAGVEEEAKNAVKRIQARLLGRQR